MRRTLFNRGAEGPPRLRGDRVSRQVTCSNGETMSKLGKQVLGMFPAATPESVIRYLIQRAEETEDTIEGLAETFMLLDGEALASANTGKAFFNFLGTTCETNVGSGRGKKIEARWNERIDSLRGAQQVDPAGGEETITVAALREAGDQRIAVYNLASGYHKQVGQAVEKCGGWGRLPALVAKHDTFGGFYASVTKKTPTPRAKTATKSGSDPDQEAHTPGSSTASPKHLLSDLLADDDGVDALDQVKEFLILTFTMSEASARVSVETSEGLLRELHKIYI